MNIGLAALARALFRVVSPRPSPTALSDGLRSTPLSVSFATDAELIEEIGRRARARNGAAVIVIEQDAEDGTDRTRTRPYFYGGMATCLGLHRLAAKDIEHRFFGAYGDDDDEDEEESWAG